MPTYTLIPLDESHLDELLALYRQCEDFLALGPRPHASPEMVLEDLALSRQNGGEYSGVYVDGQLAGVLDVIGAGYQGEAHTAYLELLMLAAAHRGRGLGAELFADLLAGLRASGITCLKAGVQVNNPGALRFWQRMGFEVVSEPRLLEDGTTCVELSMEIQ